MLPKINRLTKKRDIDEVFKKGKSLKHNFLILKTLPNGLQETRFCFIVSNKVSKKAVVRNKIRRLLSGNIDIKNIRKGMDCVVLALVGLKEKELVDNIKIILNKCLAS